MMGQMILVATYKIFGKNDNQDVTNLTIFNNGNSHDEADGQDNDEAYNDGD